MRNLLLRFPKSLRAANSDYVSAIRQGVLHLAAVYFIAWLSMPWLLDVAYGYVLPFLLGHPLRGNLFQFAFSHLLALSFLLGFAAGFGNAKSLRNGVVRFVWLVPVVVLVFSFLFRGPGMYPTLLWESDFGQAFHYFFGGGFNFVGEYHSYRDLPTLMEHNIGDFMRGYTQFRVTVPAYVAIAYSIGAWLSLRMKRTTAQTRKIQEVVAQAKSTS